MSVEKQKELFHGNTKINKAFLEVTNDYESITKQYTKITGDDINRDPIKSVLDYPLKECRYKVSIIIATWNSRKSLEFTLMALCYSCLLKNHPDKTEVIIVDDGSDDDTIGLFSHIAFPYSIHFIRQNHLGRAQALNLAIYRASGDIIVFCDSDILLTPYAIDELIKRQQIFLHDAIFFGFREDICIDKEHAKVEELLGKFLIDLNKDNRFLTDFPGLWGTNMMLETHLLQKMTCQKNMYITNNSIGLYDCWQLYRMVYGFLFSVSRENVLKVGGFAEYLVGWGFDDTEFSAKCILHGIRLIPVPSAFVGHIQHPIREKTQWEDGRNNYLRMKSHLASLQFENYITSDLEKRISEEFVIKPSIEFKFIPHEWIVFRCVQNPIQYNYILGNLDSVIELIKCRKPNELSDEELDCLFDIAIRKDSKVLFKTIQSDNTLVSDSFFGKLSSFVFDRVIPKKGWQGYSYNIAKQLGETELCKRGNVYFSEHQWYLALLDYFATFLLDTKNTESIQKCNVCVAKLRDEKRK